jgi:acyl transferase domain-containing protein/NAD(P)H-dependent flavin oxidoreductase YrpB (nitropropane dioxygenase family)/NAD(P)-dependent dehydrogenase (short-subunit alcohol dehydrogenase family)
MNPQDVIALTPPGLCHPSLAVAACRAGARGMVDLEDAASPDVALAAMARLDRFVDGNFGIKIGRHNGSLVKHLMANSPARLAWVLLAGGESPDLETWIGFFRGRHIEVFVEAVSLAEARWAEALGADGLILKGQEAGGRVGTETAFILLQRWLAYRRDPNHPGLPVWVQGGVGLNTAAACLAGGAAGVVLDSQLLLARETPINEAARQRLTAFDGSETTCLGERLGEAYRFYSRPGLAAVEELSRDEDRLCQSAASREERRAEWREVVRTRQADGSLWPLGQDACFAKPLAERFVTVSGIIQAICGRSRQQLEAARRLRPLAAGAPLAVRHKTRYPIVQGPMTRVSDTAPFADAVARAGGLPFLALALSRKAETEKLLKETRDLAAGQSWGVGILGFVPPEIRQEQIEAIRDCPPPFALIAGGRPDQARQLEKEGIVTYLHVPSPGLLRMFLKDGGRRFVFEGRECGGHVGPRTSFVLWETVCELLLEHLGPAGRGEDLQIIFAGGVHDARSAAMVSALSAGLVERGVAVGVLMGTAYLFTHEAVAAGAIVPRFQKEALECEDTILLQTGPGHAIRCIRTPYFDVFEREKRRLLNEGKSHEEVVKTLEWMNIGRLRIASKGLDRISTNGSGNLSVDAGKTDDGAVSPPTPAVKPDAPGLVTLSDEDQYARGMYMIGQAASLRAHLVTMSELHEEVSAGSQRLLDSSPTVEIVTPEPAPKPCAIAIVGMACYFPGSTGVVPYWENILNKVNVVGEVPPTHWDWRLYYDPDPRTPDKIISKWGGFLDDIPFDPFVYGITPNSLHSVEPLQLYLLEAVRHALADAGYADRPFNRERTCAVLGIGGGGNPLAVAYGFRTCLPLLDTVEGLGISGAEVLKRTEKMLPSWTEDTFPGILLNVAVGRVANRFNFGGANYAIDAACGSSLASVQACIRELETASSDVAVAMGADMVQTPYAYMAFSKTHALSPRGQCRPFDAAADGIVISEGVAAIVLKRLADAERDGDKIYAVIRGMGASSDGRDKGLTAPRAEGQLRALRRAYAQAGFSPARVSLIEAHGTGTVVGDQTEAQALGQVFREAGAELQSCAIGSVKSMIGHSKCAAGIAGLVKTALALHRKVLPPTLVDKPNPKGNFDDGPLYLNGEARPWIHGADQPRCAGVSAFGFGGTNFHLALEEYTNEFAAEPPPALNHWPAELLVWRRPTSEALLAALEQCHQALEEGARPPLADLALSLWKANRPELSQPTLAIVATSVEDLKEKLGIGLDSMRSTKGRLHDPRGIYYAEKPGEENGQVAFLFPGQGSQYPNMLGQLAMTFAEVREAFDRAEGRLAGQLERPLGRYVFPPTAFSPEKEQELRQALTRTEVAQPAVGAADLGMFHLLKRLGLKADFLAGHSYGDYVALCAAGALAEHDLPRLSYLRGKVIVDASSRTPGTMAAFDAAAEVVEALIAGVDGATLANKNAPNQTVISGTEAAVDTALAKAKAQGVRGQKIAVSRGFHSPLVAPAREPLARALAEFRFTAPHCPVFSNTTAAAYPRDPSAISALLAEHLVSPVRFHEEILAIYEAGARIFVEVGPQAVLTGLVGQILAEKPHVAVASDLKGRPGLVQLQHVLGRLLVSGLPIQLERLYEGRALRHLDLMNLQQETGKPKLAPSTWIVNSVRNRPLNAPEPILLGQPRAVVSETATPSSSRQPASQKPMTSLERTVTAAPSALTVNGAAPVPLVSPPRVPVDEATQVMLRYQELMAKFLETQKSVMTSYLQGPGPAPAAAMPSQAAPAVVAGPQGIEAATPDPAIAQLEPMPPEPKPAAMDRAWFTAQLLDLVSKRTGYPKDMLGLDQDLEADLGIDSIKRVEILGSLAEAMDGGDSSVPANLEMEKLTGLKSLRAILDYLDSALAAHNDAAPQHADSHVTQPPKQLEVQRALVRLVDAPLPARPSLRLPRGTVLFTDDGGGIAREMAGRLGDFGQHTLLIRHDAGAAHGRASLLHADLTDADAVEALLKRIRQQHGAIAGLVHLLPLATPPRGEPPLERMRREVRSLYLLARGLGEDLRQAGGDGGALLLAATGLGGGLGFGDQPLPDSYFAGHGGVVGFVKCLAFEWPDVLVRVVDLDTGKPETELVERLLVELGATGGPTEVGYLGARRITWEPVAAPIHQDSHAAPILDSASTVMITGGARGITAAVALELAARYQPNLVIVGRSALPEEAEAPDTASLTTVAEIKAGIIARLQHEGRPVAPAAVEAGFQRLMHDREIRANLARIAHAGGRVHYYQADVRDRGAVTRVLAEVEQRFGGVDGVIHGAGVIEDKLVKDKTPESFDRVFGTKTASAVLLSEHLKPERLKFCVFFASIASRYGNKGQSDYAAANETLSKLALQLDRRWPGRVISVAWGPWSGIGMVADLEKHLTQRGLKLISPEQGPVFLVDELQFGKKGETEIIIAGGMEQAAQQVRTPPTAELATVTE